MANYLITGKKQKAIKNKYVTKKEFNTYKTEDKKDDEKIAKKVVRKEKRSR